MIANNADLGNDLPSAEAPQAEHTTAETQVQTPELSAETISSETELVHSPALADESDATPAAAELYADGDVTEEPAEAAAEADEQVQMPELSAETILSETEPVHSTALADESDATPAAAELYADGDVTEEPAEAAAEAEEQIQMPELSAETILSETEPVHSTALADESDAAPAAVELYPDEEAAEEPAEAAAEAEGQRLRRGVILDGTVAETSPTEVLVDLGEGVIGVVASRELERMDRAALEVLKAGSPVTAYVLKAQGADGRPVLSLARAEEENNWRLAETYHQNQQVYFSKVAGYNKGGLIVRFGKVRGFVPASQVSLDRQRRAAGASPEERWGSMVGDDIAVKVVEMDRARNRLILSERAAAREWREQQKARLLDQLSIGEVRTGRVISVADFGAFVDLGGADGLVHLTEMSWKHITHPREVLQVGDSVEVQVISVDRERKRIGLSMKRKENDPWEEVVRRYHIGQLVQATITKLTKFGAFARLVEAPEVEGLVHISELADYRVNHPRDVVLVNDVLTLRIVKIDRDQRRLGLSLRQVDSAKYLDQDWQAATDEIGTPDSAEEADEPQTD